MRLPRRRAASPGCFLVVVALLASCKQGPGTRTPEQRGRSAYTSYNCKQCHVIGEEGGKIGPDLTYVGFRKNAAFLDLWLKDPRAWQTGTKMPAFGYTEGVRKDLVAYLSSLQGQAYAAVKPWDVPEFKSDPAKRGRELYQRLGCGTCHGNNGEGGMRNNNVPGEKIAALRETVANYSREELDRKIRHGVPHPEKEDPKGPEPMLSMPAWDRKLTDDELAGLIVYLRTFKPTTNQDW